MDRPNRTTNRNSGIQEVIDPVDLKSRNDSRWPCWKIHTSTPYAAPTDSRLSRIALIGITIERNVSSSNTNASPRTNANTIGARDLLLELKSAFPADSPVTA